MKRTRHSTGLAVLLAPLACTPLLFGWGGDGHEITAHIAALHLSENAQQMVFRMLKIDPDTASLLAGKTRKDTAAIAAAMARAATWPDRVKKQAKGKGTGEWHFLDLASDEGAEAIAGRCGTDGNCVAEKIRTLRANIPVGTTLSTPDNTYTTAEELKFLIHFAGDIHQPLHCATNADGGGNCINTSGFSQSELHAVWDTGMVKPLHGKKPNKKDNAGVAAALDAEFAAKFAEWSGTTDEQTIALESHGVAFDVAYAPVLPLLPSPEPRPFKRVIPPKCLEAPEFKSLPAIKITTLYDDTTKAIVRQQLAKGGFRLAAILNAMAP